MADYFADAYFGSKYWTADYFQGGETAETVTEAATYTGGSLNYLNPRKYRIEKEEEREELRKEIVRIGEASQSEVITGIVQTPRKARQPNIETLARVARQRREAEQARIEQIRRQIAADDEWLMLA